MKVNIKLLNDLAKIPERATLQSAGYDLYAATEKDVIIPPHSTFKINTGVSVELPNGTFGGIFARSGLATKKGLRPANCVGVIDADYRGPVIVALHNDTDMEMAVSAGERIAQLIVMPFVTVEFNTVDELTDTKRSNSGFGSTGQF